MSIGIVGRAEPDPQATKEWAVLRLDSFRAREELGWRPGWDLEAGLEATASWYRPLSRGEDPRATTLAQIGAYPAG